MLTARGPAPGWARSHTAGGMVTEGAVARGRSAGSGARAEAALGAGAAVAGMAPLSARSLGTGTAAATAGISAKYASGSRIERILAMAPAQGASAPGHRLQQATRPASVAAELAPPRAGSQQQAPQHQQHTSLATDPALASPRARASPRRAATHSNLSYRPGVNLAAEPAAAALQRLGRLAASIGTRNGVATAAPRGGGSGGNSGGGRPYGAVGLQASQGLTCHEYGVSATVTGDGYVSLVNAASGDSTAAAEVAGDREEIAAAAAAAGGGNGLLVSDSWRGHGLTPHGAGPGSTFYDSLSLSHRERQHQEHTQATAHMQLPAHGLRAASPYQKWHGGSGGGAGGLPSPRATQPGIFAPPQQLYLTKAAKHVPRLNLSSLGGAAANADGPDPNGGAAAAAAATASPFTAPPAGGWPQELYGSDGEGPPRRGAKGESELASPMPRGLGSSYGEGMSFGDSWGWDSLEPAGSVRQPQQHGEGEGEGLQVGEQRSGAGGGLSVRWDDAVLGQSSGGGADGQREGEEDGGESTGDGEGQGEGYGSPCTPRRGLQSAPSSRSLAAGQSFRRLAVGAEGRPAGQGRGSGGGGDGEGQLESPLHKLVARGAALGAGAGAGAEVKGEEAAVAAAAAAAAASDNNKTLQVGAGCTVHCPYVAGIMQGKILAT